MYSDEDPAKAGGCPIRIFTDQSLFAAPHDFSQRTTSFIASQCQGIHQMPLSRLIALIIRTQVSGIRCQERHPKPGSRAQCQLRFSAEPKATPGSLMEKLILCIHFVRTWRGQAPQPAARGQFRQILHSRCQSAQRTLLQRRNWFQ